MASFTFEDLGIRPARRCLKQLGEYCCSCPSSPEDSLETSPRIYPEPDLPDEATTEYPLAEYEPRSDFLPMESGGEGLLSSGPPSGDERFEIGGRNEDEDDHDAAATEVLSQVYAPGEENQDLNRSMMSIDTTQSDPGDISADEEGRIDNVPLDPFYGGSSHYELIPSTYDIGSPRTTPENGLLSPPPNPDPNRTDHDVSAAGDWTKNWPDHDNELDNYRPGE